MLVTDTAGGTLQGAIDGENVLYRTSLDYDADSVAVYVNGRLKVLLEDFEDGADILGNRHVRMRTPLLLGDTLAVEYQLAGQASLGGAPSVGQAGIMASVCPQNPIISAQVCELAPPRVSARASECGR